jgi:hypothetical protein
MLFAIAFGIFALVLAAIMFAGGFAEERRNDGSDDIAAPLTTAS